MSNIGVGNHRSEGKREKERESRVDVPDTIDREKETGCNQIVFGPEKSVGTHRFSYVNLVR